MDFGRYLLRRLLITLPLLLGITLVSFLIANAVPADPVTASLPTNALNNEELVQAFREKWGLDEPLHIQYLTYVGNLLQGDMGTSIKTSRPVIDDIRQFLPATIELSTYALIIGISIGISFGVLSAVYRDTLLDYLLRAFALVGVSFPVFLLALAGLAIFYAELGWVAGPGRLGFRTQDPPNLTGWFTVDALLNGDMETFGEAFSH
ncbi:MAG: ABC transporter permease, partial [Chloroflexota bacterium]